MSDQYAVSIRHSYTMPDETFYGYELVLWHWDVIENTWLFRATREYPVSKTVSRKQALEQALYDAEELARIFQCKVLQEEEMSRAETTAMLSKLVEKRLRNQTAFWASEVNFDRNTPDERRVDYVGFKPWNINGEPVPASVEKGCFEFYEVKSCMADFTSGNGLTFYGDQNYLVCTKELCDEIVWQKMVPPRVNAILTPDSTGSKLILDYVQSYNDLSYRRRPASEILWAMVKANGKRTN